ncbi:MAG: c-type cytochrome [Candidatus Binataceae bacterium]
MKAPKTLIALAVAGLASAAMAAEPPADKGEYVARLGNCVACHSVPNAPAFSGGLKMATPLGAIYTTNITPDPETGIGSYSLEEFDRAVRLGIAKDGHRLYPAMPYPSYAKMTSEDVAALYNFFMKSVPAAKVANKPSEIKSPLNMRWPIAIWNVLFASSDRYKAKANHDAAWNRGAYLVQGAGHCGACHTPRGFAFNEKGYDEDSSSFVVGAPLDNWSAANLRGDGLTGLARWSHEDLVSFLKNGHNSFGTAFGTMTDVINYSTQYMSDADIDAMATYLQSLPGGREGKSATFTYDASSGQKLASQAFEAPGALTYMQQCMACHLPDGKGSAPYLPPLAGNPVVADPSPASLINVVLNGSNAIVVDGLPDAYRMPQYRVLLGDQEVADVVTFIRQGWGNKAAAVTAKDVADIRKLTDPASDQVQILRMK